MPNLPIAKPVPRSWDCEVIDHTLTSAATEEHFVLHHAALEWSLMDPISINSPADVKATGWQERGLKPFKHQFQNLMTFCRRLPVAVIADDVGLGKTVSAGLILSELMARNRVRRALIVCPKVLGGQWVIELRDKFGIESIFAVGAKVDQELKQKQGVLITTWESARDRLEKIQPGQYEMCIFDEAHKLRNLHGTQKPPQLALKVRSALQRQIFKFVLMLTATPQQNSLWDLYSLIDLLKVAEGKPNPLSEPAAFAKQYLVPTSNSRHLLPAMQDRFQRIVRESLSRTRRAELAGIF
ncbi:MAG: SNF2-related protein, partial [Gemmataceae bacterium]